MGNWVYAAMLMLGLSFGWLAGETPGLPDLPKLTVADFRPEVRS